jgi:hypothetical protein
MKQLCLFRFFRYRFENRNKPKYFVFGFTIQTETNAKQILFRFDSVRTEIYFCLFRGHPISDRSIRILLAVTNNPSRFSLAQACGGVAAAVSGAVETVPGAAGSCIELAAASVLVAPEEKSSSDTAAALEDAALTTSSHLCGRPHL